MAKIYRDKDAKLELLKGKTIGIIGYGSLHERTLVSSHCP